ncbi:MAG TPA: ABC transporter permease [Archangium sp.]|uniref:ABC transporter permease n=1 Tax=Archangium sp. TaxID=1872627 RepID=UPI002E31B3E2|nr:ABC transporter permease [Archangium sp.]HEX5747421.1 ABC transporter permease [Archangium sp.]
MKILREALAPLTALAILLVLWETVARVFSVSPIVLPPPSAIGLEASRAADTLLSGALSTGRSALLGFGLSTAVGVLAAIVLSSSRVLERALYPYALFLQMVPIIAIAPVLVVWFGHGARAVAVSSFIVSVFPVIANTHTGMRSVDPALRDMFRLYGARRVATLWKLELPASLPHLFTGLRVASGLSVVGAIVGEWVAGVVEGDAGLGILVLAANRQGNTARVFAAVLAASMLGLMLFGAVSLTGERMLRRWHPSASGS